jgi:hypothetical protein
MRGGCGERPADCETPLHVLERMLRGTDAWETYLRLARVRAGQMTANEAMVEAGFRQPPPWGWGRSAQSSHWPISSSTRPRFSSCRSLIRCQRGSSSTMP